MTPAPGWHAPAALAARLLVGAAFLFSGVEKAASGPAEFAVVIEAYRLVPDSLLLPMAALLPWLEAFLGMCLLSGYALPATFAAAAAFLSLFIVAIASTLLRKIPLESCGCFGGAIHLSPPQALTLDCALFSASLWARRRATPLALDGWIARGR